MTKPRNFHGRKKERREAALERILKSSKEIIQAHSKEIEILKDRISKGGRRYTKKVGINKGAF